MPFLCVLLAIQCWLLWEDNLKLRENVERFEMDYQTAEFRAERLENLEILLQEENISGRELILRQLAQSGKEDAVIEEATIEEPAPDLTSESGPGHEDFPVIDTGRVKIENVQIRALRGKNLRVGLDLRNPDNENLLAGEVEATLVTADGERKILSFAPQDAGNFRINRFKRAVMTAQTPNDANLVNASIILEVREQNGDVLYQNIFAVQR